MSQKKRILTGDTPTGKLHLGHYVGSIENALALQDEYECYFPHRQQACVHDARGQAGRNSPERDRHRDRLARGRESIRTRATMFIQSEVPAIDELTFFFAMLIPFNRVMRNPTLKDEIRDKGLGDNYPFGFPMYAVGQCADILAFRPELVPVGEDQIPHLELTREVARRFDQMYCGVEPAHGGQGLREGGRAVSDHRAEARPREATGRHRRAISRNGPASEDEQVAEQRDLPLG